MSERAYVVVLNEEQAKIVREAPMFWSDCTIYESLCDPPNEDTQDEELMFISFLAPLLRQCRALSTTTVLDVPKNWQDAVDESDQLCTAILEFLKHVGPAERINRGYENEDVVHTISAKHVKALTDALEGNAQEQRQA